MNLTSPVIITARLLPGLQVGNGSFISIEYKGSNSEGRTVYQYHIDLPDGQSYTGSDLKSGCQGGSLQEGLASLLSFLGACAESVRYGKGGENADLFPANIAEWASKNSDEISMLACEIEETPNLIEE